MAQRSRPRLMPNVAKKSCTRPHKAKRSGGQWRTWPEEISMSPLGLRPRVSECEHQQALPRLQGEGRTPGINTTGLMFRPRRMALAEGWMPERNLGRAVGRMSS